MKSGVSGEDSIVIKKTLQLNYLAWQSLFFSLYLRYINEVILSPVSFVPMDSFPAQISGVL